MPPQQLSDPVQGLEVLQGGWQEPARHIFPGEHSASELHDRQSWSTVQTPLAQACPEAHPRRQVWD